MSVLKKETKKDHKKTEHVIFADPVEKDSKLAKATPVAETPVETEKSLDKPDKKAKRQKPEPQNATPVAKETKVYKAKSLVQPVEVAETKSEAVAHEPVKSASKKEHKQTEKPFKAEVDPSDNNRKLQQALFEMHSKMIERDETISKQEAQLKALRQQVRNYQEDLSALNS